MTDPLGIYARRAGSNAHRYGEDERSDRGGEHAYDADGRPEVESSAADHGARRRPFVVLHTLAIGEDGEEHVIALSLAGPLGHVGSEEERALEGILLSDFSPLTTPVPHHQNQPNQCFLEIGRAKRTGWIRVEIRHPHIRQIRHYGITEIVPSKAFLPCSALLCRGVALALRFHTGQQPEDTAYCYSGSDQG